MFQQQPQQPPQQFAHRKPNVIPSATQNEAQAKEKLVGYVYEFLVYSGAQKSAEMFKNEVLIPMNLAQMNVSPAEAPGFLNNWWSVFWDLYAATPERRDKLDSSVEAKAFHEFGFIPPSTFNPGHMLNGVHPNNQFGNGGAPPMGIPPNEIPNYFRNNSSQGPATNQSSPLAGGPRYGGNTATGARSGAPTPSGVMGNAGSANGPPNFQAGGLPPGSHMFNEQMRNMVQAQQRMNATGPRIPGFNPAAVMRPMRPGTIFPGGGPPFLDSPSGTPPFPQQAGGPMMPNGMCSMISSPGSQPNGGSNGPMGGPGGMVANPDGTLHDPRFMMISGGGANLPGPFPMGHHDGAGTPTSAGNNTVPTGFNSSSAGTGMHGCGPNGADNSSMSGGGPLQNLLNGGSSSGGNSNEMDMKQSPSHLNGTGTPVGAGTSMHMNPGSIQQPQTAGGPSSVHGCQGEPPGSVHSQHGGGMGGGPNSHQGAYQQATNSEAPQTSMDFQPSRDHGSDEQEKQEISKIKKNLIEDFNNY